MLVLYKYIFLSLSVFYIFMLTVSCSNENTKKTDEQNTEVPDQQQTPAASNSNNDNDILYIIRNKTQQKRILYADKNNKETLLTLMAPETFCLKIKASDFSNIQKIGLSSNLKDFNQLICSNEQKPSSTTSKCDLRSFKITNSYKVEPLDLSDEGTNQLIKKDYESSCIEFVSWL